MKRKIFCTIFCVLAFSTSNAQIISIVGEAVGGWPDNDPNTPDTHILSTTDNVTYTITNLVVTTAAAVNGGAKFRRDGGWTTNWGGSTFPSGTGIQNGSNIPTVSGTYDVTINISNGTYTFIGSSFPSIGIWGPAVDSQNGYAGADVDMTTTNGITYTLSGFNFSSGNAYFRQDNTTTNVWGSTAFPTGTAVNGGPSIFIPGNEWFVTFNRNTGAYSFTYPSVGILGTALNGFSVEDIDLTTTNGFSYSISNLVLTNGDVKFRKDNLWTTNWGSTSFPTGIGTQNGANIPVTAGTYNITFDKSTGNYNFQNSLIVTDFTNPKIKLYPNPSKGVWHLNSKYEIIESLKIVDVQGKEIAVAHPKTNEVTIDATLFANGLYFIELTTLSGSQIIKALKN